MTNIMGAARADGEPEHRTTASKDKNAVADKVALSEVGSSGQRARQNGRGCGGRSTSLHTHTAAAAQVRKDVGQDATALGRVGVQATASSENKYLGCELSTYWERYSARDPPQLTVLDTGMR